MGRGGGRGIFPLRAWLGLACHVVGTNKHANCHSRMYTTVSTRESEEEEEEEDEEASTRPQSVDGTGTVIGREPTAVPLERS
ncbi:hypothetical protein LY76DRAFT_587332 [Colletotrichum caudatum]|nr:hypothetical protein LY76DRAFT_587332 [Colletotrichum caudatum]